MSTLRRRGSLHTLSNSSSLGNKGHRERAGFGLTVLKPVGQHAEGQRLGRRECLRFGGAVGEHARQGWDLGDPAALVLALDLHGEHLTHALTLPPVRRGRNPTA